MIALLVLVFSIAGPAFAQTVNWNADPAAHFASRVAAARKKDKQKKPKPDESTLLSSVAAPDSASLTPEQLACQPDVIAGFKAIFAQAGSGSVPTEAAMRIDLVDGQRKILIAPKTNEFKKTNVPLSTDTIAIAHTHPTSGAGSGQPSSQDETSPVPNFVVTNWALWVTNPHPAKHEPHSRRVRYQDWKQPCQEAK